MLTLECLARWRDTCIRAKQRKNDDEIDEDDDDGKKKWIKLQIYELYQWLASYLDQNIWLVIPNDLISMVSWRRFGVVGGGGGENDNKGTTRSRQMIWSRTLFRMNSCTEFRCKVISSIISITPIFVNPSTDRPTDQPIHIDKTCWIRFRMPMPMSISNRMNHAK